MRLERSARAGAWLLTLCALCAMAGMETEDPLASEIARWEAYVQERHAAGGMWADIQQSSQPQVASAAQALRDGRRLLALQRLAAAFPGLAAAVYLDGQAKAALETGPGFENEWNRMGKVLSASLATPRSDALAGVRPAAARALAEEALLQVRGYYETGLEYGQNTQASVGLYYVGVAQGQRDFVAFARTLSEPRPRSAPKLRSIASELDAFEDAMLAAYRPPASIDRHREFIRASSALKEARELDAAGLLYGALDRYLAAALRLSSAPADSDVAAKLGAFEARLDADPADHTIGRLYVEMARADLAAATPGAPPGVAAAIAADVLPRYFEALAPARPAAPRPAAEVRVTLVRWPYT